MKHARVVARGLACLPLLLGPLLNGGTSRWNQGLLTLTALLAFLVIVLRWAFWSNRSRVHSDSDPNLPFVLSMSGWVAWVWLSCLWSLNTLDALRSAGLWTGCAAVALSLHFSGKHRSTHTWALATLLIGGALSLGIALLQENTIYISGYQYIKGPFLTGPFYNPSHFAGYLIVVAGVSSALLVKTRHWVLTPLLLGLLMATAYVTIRTDSSSAPAVFLTFPLAALLWLKLKYRPSGVLVFLLPLLLSSAVGFGFFTPFGQQLFAQSKGVLGLGNSWSSFIEGRLNVWDYGIRMWADHPLEGVGIGQFSSASPGYRRSFSETKSTVDLLLVNHPHNDLLHIGSETGGIGIALFILMLGCALVHRGVQLSHYALRISFLALSFAGLYDAHLTAVPGTMFVFWGLLGLAARSSKNHSARAKSAESSEGSLTHSSHRETESTPG